MLNISFQKKNSGSSKDNFIPTQVTEKSFNFLTSESSLKESDVFICICYTLQPGQLIYKFKLFKCSKYVNVLSILHIQLILKQTQCKCKYLNQIKEQQHQSLQYLIGIKSLHYIVCLSNENCIKLLEILRIDAKLNDYIISQCFLSLKVE